MSWVRMIITLVGAVAGSLCQPVTALAMDPAGAAPRYLLFSGVDLWRNGGFGHGGLVWSPKGLSHAGPAVKLLFGAGSYRYRAGPIAIDGAQTVASVLPGWRFAAPGWEITVFAGLDVQRHRLRPDDSANSLRGTQAGLRAGIEWWWEPAPATMLTGALSLATVGTSYWARFASGWRLVPSVWIGPEVAALGDDAYHQWRIGAHATGFTTATLEWSGGVGFVHDSDARQGVYGRIGVLARR